MSASPTSGAGENGYAVQIVRHPDFL